MLEYVSTRQVDLVVVHKLDRLARNRADDVQIVEALRGAGVRLVSTTENIDETASGRLVHGIMASIAEFYSHNLATEVKKGLRQKVEESGTVGLAPISYVNVRCLGPAGRAFTGEVDIDHDRAPHIRWAFEQYAFGTWSLPRPVDTLTSRGLSSRPSKQKPGAPLGLSAVHRMLRNAYYKGVVTLHGVEYPGSHPPLISAALWERVQLVLAARRCGERARVHTHFLKGLLHCYSCDRRLILQHVTCRSGKRYTYFACSGRQANRINCRQHAIPVAEAEHRVEQLIACLSITAAQRQQIERQDIERHRAATNDRLMQLSQIEERLHELEERQLKLLDAYYAGALPRELFLDQQRDLTRRRAQAGQARDRLAARGADIHRELALHLDVLKTATGPTPLVIRQASRTSTGRYSKESAWDERSAKRKRSSPKGSAIWSVTGEEI